MTYAVVVVPRTQASQLLASGLFSDTECVAGFDRDYRLYSCSDVKPARYRDPVDGTLLVELLTFYSAAAARRWIVKDDERRRWRA